MVLSIIVAAMLANSSADVCAPKYGVQDFSSIPTRKWTVFGELHGTNETPDAFVKAVCIASQSASVVVAVEQAEVEQQAIDAYMASDGDPKSRSDFSKGMIWNGQTKTGTSSEAMFLLFEHLRILHAAGRVARVVAFVPLISIAGGVVDRGARERKFAESLMAKTEGDAKVLALVGNYHARRTPASFSPGVLPMAAYLPADRSIAVNVQANGGTAWNCVASGCGIHSSGGDGIVRNANWKIETATGTPYAVTWYIGQNASASPPH